MEIKKIETSEWTLPKLLLHVEDGLLRIPKFQREFVWSKSETINLLDSIYREYPVGSLFFWNPPENLRNMYREIEELQQKHPSRAEAIRMILDGQQRITSIYAVSKGLTINNTDYSKIVFDLNNEMFSSKNADSVNFVSFKDIIDEDRFLDIYNNLSDDKKKILQKCSTRFKNYPFSIVEVFDKDLEEVCDIFERINQGGQKLTLFDLVVAGTWSEDFDLRIKVKEFNEKSRDERFGEINPDVFIQALALMVKGQCVRKSQLQLTNEEIKNNWDKLIQNLELAIDYVKESMGVYKFEMIPYPGLLVLFTYLFNSINGRSLTNGQKQLSRQWFWQAALSERYGSSTLTSMTEDRKLMNKIAQNINIAASSSLKLTSDDLIDIKMGRKSAIKNAVLCLLGLKKPKHFENGSEINVDDHYFSDFWSTEKHHIFPKKFLAKKGIPISDVNLLPNFCFIPGELNKMISDTEPNKYFSKYKNNKDFKKIMNSHLIPVADDSGIWTNEYEKFIRQRADLIIKELKKLYQV